MKVKAKKSFHSPYTGNAVKGAVYDVPDKIAAHMEDYGLCEVIVEKKPTATGDSGRAKQSQSLQADQALKGGSAITSEESVGSSQSTAATSGQSSQTRSTDATGHGGSATTKKSRTKRKSGRKTKSQASGLD